MTFTSFYFLLFFACLLGVYYLVPKRFQLLFLLAASLFFCYFAGGKRMLLSLFIATISTWYAALKMETTVLKRRKKLYFYGVLLFNVGILILLKYLNFFVYTGRAIGTIFHVDVPWTGLSFIAPLGVSFYTLQVLGYLIDVSRGTCKAQRSLLRYAAFSCFFPQLVTGPINRYGELQERLYERKSFDYERVTFGLQRIAWGFFKKLVISERMAVIVNTVYGDYQTYNGLYIGFATACFAFQLYTDFSGAMDIALGVSEALGIRMAENFDTPFFSRSISEYWRRWHITLGTWMKDYIFYPVLKSDLFVRIGEKAKQRLGKKRGKKVPLYLGMVILWFTVGMWHGGAWKYIIGSGLLHCFYIVFGQILEPVFKKLIKLFQVNTDCFSYRLFQGMRTFFLVCIGFVFFRASSFRGAVSMFKASLYPNIWIFTDGSLLKLGLDPQDFVVGWISLGALLLVSLLQQKLRMKGTNVVGASNVTGAVDTADNYGVTGVRKLLSQQNLVFRWLIYYALIFSVIIFGFYGPGYDASEFIYQNF